MRGEIIAGIFGLGTALITAGGSIIVAEIGEQRVAIEQRHRADAQQLQLEASRSAECPIVLNALSHQNASTHSAAADPERSLLDEGARRCIGLLPAPKDMPEAKSETRS